MPNVPKIKLKSSCEQVYRSANSSSSEKKTNNVKKVLKNTAKNPKEVKCCSAGALSNYGKAPLAKPKKTTKSTLCFTHNNIPSVNVIDFCKKCGDQIDNKTCLKEKTRIRSAEVDRTQIVTTASKSSSSSKSNKGVERTVISSRSITSQDIPSTSAAGINMGNTKLTYANDIDNILINRQPVQQYYKNENFQRTSSSTQELYRYFKRISLLDTIKEQPESLIEDGDSNLFKIYSDSDDYYSHEDSTDGDEYDSLKKLREFRDENYFETHSSQSRVKNKGSVTSLHDHECVYRFYLNDRLFPVPLNSDHRKTIRCTKCYLPLDFKKGAKDINGTIQTKVKIGSADEAQDMCLMLPVKEPLIIKQKREESKTENDKTVYFGVIKLDSYGNSIFNQTLPSDSLALKYQKGYKEFRKLPDGYEYKNCEESEVVVI